MKNSINTFRIDSEHPWPGLLPFTEEASAFFHGRETESNELTRLIEREPLTVLFGQSGLGKSSLLNAGVFPRLRRAGYLPLYLRLNLDADAPALIDQVWQTLKDECVRHEVAANAPKAGDSFWKYLHRAETELLNPHGRSVMPVLVFDQFEEIFTLGRLTPEQAVRCQAFMRELGELIENRLPPSLEDELTEHPEMLDAFDLLRQNLKIVFAFREDYLAEFEGLKTLIRPIMQNRMRLTPMTGRQAAQAIKESGADKVSEAIAARIARFVGGAGRDDSIPLETVSVEPALLSLVCRELNEQRLKRGQTEISADLIQGDNTQQIIENFYRQGFNGVDDKVKYFVEDRLLTAAGYRDSAALDNALAETGITEVALQTLVDRRILRREERGGLVRLELIHDVLAGVAKASRDQRQGEVASRERFVVSALSVAVASFVFWLPIMVYLIEVFDIEGIRSIDSEDSNEAVLWYAITLAHLLIGIGLTWIYRDGLKARKSFLTQGLRFGVKVSIFSAIPTALIYYAMHTTPIEMMFQQVVLGTAVTMALCIITAWVNRATGRVFSK